MTSPGTIFQEQNRHLLQCYCMKRGRGRTSFDDLCFELSRKPTCSLINTDPEVLFQINFPNANYNLCLLCACYYVSVVLICNPPQTHTFTIKASGLLRLALVDEIRTKRRQQCFQHHGQRQSCSFVADQFVRDSDFQNYRQRYKHEYIGFKEVRVCSAPWTELEPSEECVGFDIQHHGQRRICNYDT